MGKKKKSTGAKSKITTETKIVDNKSAKIVEDYEGNKHLVVLEQTDYYTFTNLRPGIMVFKREDGKDEILDGRTTINNITKKEREMLLKSKDFSNGWLVEEKEDEEVTEESIMNKNAMSDERLDKLIDKYGADGQEVLKSVIFDMDSDFAIKRIKERLIAKNLPASLLLTCDTRLQELEEIYMESMKAPIDKAEQV